MRFLKSFIIVLLSGSFLIASQLSFAKSVDSRTMFAQRIHEILQQETLAHNIPGACLSVDSSEYGLINTCVGVRDIEQNLPMNSETLFDIGSITKSFTSAVILSLVEKNKLSLHTNLAQFSKQYPHSIIAYYVKQFPDVSKITVRELLNHTSGLAPSRNSEKFTIAFAQNPYQHWSLNHFIMTSLQEKRIAKPGMHFQYADTNYFMLGEIIKTITKQPLAKTYNAIFKKANLKNIYVPIKFDQNLFNSMTHAYYTPTQSHHSPPMIKLYESFPKVMLPGQSPIPGYDLTQIVHTNLAQDFPAGGIVTTSSTIAQWAKALFSGQVISKSLIKKMVNNPVLESSGKGFTIHYGLGVRVEYVKKYNMVFYQHGGLEPGLRNIFVYIPANNTSISLLTNLENDYVDSLTTGIISKILPLVIKHPSK